MVLVLIFHIVRLRLPSRPTGSFTITLPDFLELSCRLGSRAGEFWTHFLIYQRKMNHAIYLTKWFAGELPEVNGNIHRYTFFSDSFLKIAFILILVACASVYQLVTVVLVTPTVCALDKNNFRRFSMFIEPDPSRPLLHLLITSIRNTDSNGLC